MNHLDSLSNEPGIDDGRLENLFTLILSELESIDAKFLHSGVQDCKDFRVCSVYVRLLGHAKQDLTSLHALFRHSEPLMRYSLLYAHRVSHQLPELDTYLWKDLLFDESIYVQREAQELVVQKNDVIRSLLELVTMDSVLKGHEELALLKFYGVVLKRAHVQNRDWVVEQVVTHFVLDDSMSLCGAAMEVLRQISLKNEHLANVWIEELIGKKRFETAVKMIGCFDCSLRENFIEQISDQISTMDANAVIALMDLKKDHGKHSEFCRKILSMEWNGSSSNREKVFSHACLLLRDEELETSVVLSLLDMSRNSQRILRNALTLSSDWNDDILRERLKQIMESGPWNAMLCWSCVFDHLKKRGMKGNECLFEVCLDAYENYNTDEMATNHAWEGILTLLPVNHPKFESLVRHGLSQSSSKHFVVRMLCGLNEVPLKIKSVLMERMNREELLSDDYSFLVECLTWILLHPTDHPKTPEILRYSVIHWSRMVRLHAWKILNVKSDILCERWNELGPLCTESCERLYEEQTTSKIDGLEEGTVVELDCCD